MEQRKSWILLAAILSTFCLIVLMSSKAVIAKENEIVVEVSGTEQLGRYFDSVGYNVAANPDILNAIPRFRFTHIPKNWEEDTSVPLKKSVFFRAGASAILQVNESILDDRQKLLNLKLNDMSQKDRQWLTQMMSTYKVTGNDGSFTDEQISELIIRVDAIPPSMALITLFARAIVLYITLHPRGAAVGIKFQRYSLRNLPEFIGLILALPLGRSPKMINSCPYQVVS